MGASKTMTSQTCRGDIHIAYDSVKDVIRGILQRELAGASLHTAAMRAENRPLFAAAIHRFRTWGAALRASGIDVEDVSGKRKWTPNRVLHEIRQLDSKGVPLNNRSIKRTDQGLTQAARKLWGSWDGALLAAGYDPQTIRRLRSIWTKPETIEALRDHVASGARVIQDALRPRSLAAACRRLFGSFENALRAADLDVAAETIPRWSQAAVIDCIRARKNAKQPLNCSAVIREHGALYDAARRYHGSWTRALRAAGFDPAKVRAVRQPWTPEAVVQELRRRADAGKPPTCISSIRPIPFVQACQRFFGSCAAAAVAAGVDPTKIGYFRSPGNGLHRPRRQGPSNARPRSRKRG